MANTKTDWKTTDQPCRRVGCDGGVWRGRGICFRCNGSGREMVAVEREMTADEQTAAKTFQAGVAAAQAREAARKAGLSFGEARAAGVAAYNAVMAS